MTWLIVPAAVMIWLLYQIASRLDRIRVTLVENANEVPAPREPASAPAAPGADIPAPDFWLHPFAFSLDELTTQRAYVEVLAERGLASLHAEPPRTDYDAIVAEIQVARRHFAAMIQANQRVRAGSALVTEARDEVIGDQHARLVPLPLGGAPEPEFAHRYKMDALENVGREFQRKKITRRFLRDGVIVWQRDDESDE